MCNYVNMQVFEICEDISEYIKWDVKIKMYIFILWHESFIETWHFKLEFIHNT